MTMRNKAGTDVDDAFNFQSRRTSEFH
jgi:hypothetical protein